MKEINAVTAFVQSKPRLPLTLWQVLTFLAEGAEDSGGYSATIDASDLRYASRDLDMEMVKYLDAPRMGPYAETRLQDGLDITPEVFVSIAEKFAKIKGGMTPTLFAITYRIMLHRAAVAASKVMFSCKNSFAMKDLQEMSNEAQKLSREVMLTD